jgi:DNA-binding SARP family transcriptional activator/TolB-like protein
MIKLRTLGGLQLTDSDGSELRSLLAQPKRLALLVYLAAHNHHTSRRRDSIVALFWPELDTDHARGALRQALRFLRHALGAGVLNGDNEEEVGFEPQTLECDAVAFERSCDAGRPADALELYRGDFLEGFFVSGGSPELERWIESERTRLRQLAVRAAARAAEQAERTGDLAGALQAARRAIALDPDDESALARLIELLDRSGDRAGAMRVYDEFASQLAVDHQVEPSPETQALIRAVRLRTATKSGLAPAPVGAPAGDVVTSHAAWKSRRSQVAMLGAGVIAAVALVVGLSRSPKGVPASDLVAVLPFRVTGATADLAYLREGMVDLLVPTLSGDTGSRVILPRTVMRAWREAVSGDGQDLPDAAALTLARRLGAGRLLLGSVVGTPQRLVLNASLVDAADGKAGAQATVTGPSDSLSALIDQLAAQLLARQAGEVEARVATLTSTSLPALRAYLGGQAAYRRGEYSSAVKYFHDALDLDSTFALADLGLASAETWIGGASGRTVAWNNRARLGWRDRALLAAMAGPEYPRPSSLPGQRAAWVGALEALPDQPEAWFWLGEFYFHEGAALRLASPHGWAAQALERAIALDSTFAAPLVHRIDLAAMDGDTALVRRLGARYMTVDSIGDLSAYVRWRVATSLGDSGTLVRLRAGMNRLPTVSLWEIENIGQLDAVGLEDVERAAAVLERRRGAGSERWLSLTYSYNLGLNRGRPQSALATLAAVDVATPAGHNAWRTLVLDGLFANGDSSAAAQAARKLSRRAEPAVDRDPDARDQQLYDLCVSELWRATHRDFSSVQRAIDRLGSSDDQGLCAAILHAIEANALSRRDARAAVDDLDSTLQTVSSSASSITVAAALTLARLRWEQGDPRGALMAIRGRGYGRVSGGGPYFLATCFREEARLAAMVGDRAGALRSYSQYLALRSNPEPSVQGEVDAVRTELARLTRRAP